MNFERIKNMSIPILIFRIISIIIIAIALVILFNWHLENKNNNDIIEDIKSQIVYLDDIPKQSETLLDFTEFLKYNEDTVAWIEVNNTKIDFPVVKTDNNEFYMKHNFYKKNNSAGWIFADCRNKFDSSDKNIIIYGHNRRNGSMFSSLNNVLEKSWYQNEENQIITLYTPNETAHYQIFSISKIPASHFDNTTSFESDEQFETFLNNSLENSIYDFNVDVSSSDQILTLYTCANNNQYRIIVQAKKI